ncbi:MAG: hypothetical protein RBT73_02515 [Spirochaetia bacterium]|jgi:hypothetical protein|nr:hypothetical protein [Spirochaetia bacterium]
MKEHFENQRPIGGEFELNPQNFMSEAAQCGPLFSSGRAAYRAILRHVRQSGFDSIFLPDYLCDSVTEATTREGFRIETYKIGEGLSPEKSLLYRAAGRLILVVDYFGLTDIGQTSAMVRDSGGIVIADLVQSPFAAKPAAADYAFGGYRKYLAVPEGAYAFAGENTLIPEEPASEAGSIKACGGLIKSIAREKKLSDRLYLDLFTIAENIFDKEELIAKAGRMAALLRNPELDEEIKQRRKENFSILSQAIESIGLKPLVPAGPSAIPLALPVAVKNRDIVRRMLMEERIYLPVHWPRLSGEGYCGFLSDHELSLVIDQRYGLKDMRRIAKALEKAGAMGASYDHQ